MFKLAGFIDDERDVADNRAVRSVVWSSAAKAMHGVAVLSCQCRAVPPAA